MGDFEYSLEALNVLNKFHGVEKVVYVEGEDDIPFWEQIFAKFAEFTVEVESVGGKPELLKYAEAIHSGVADFLVAMDADFDNYLGKKEHPNIIKTLGYSIENTLICCESICKIIKALARVSNKDSPREICNAWLDDLNTKVRVLVLADIMNAVEGFGLQVVPENGDRFMKSSTSSELCQNKINEYIVRLSIKDLESMIKEKSAEIDSQDILYRDLLRGHFLFSSVMRFIKVNVKKMGKGISISSDMLFSNFIALFESCFNEAHPHYEYFREKVSEVCLDV